MKGCAYSEGRKAHARYAVKIAGGGKEPEAEPQIRIKDSSCPGAGGASSGACEMEETLEMSIRSGIREVQRNKQKISIQKKQSNCNGRFSGKGKRSKLARRELSPPAQLGEKKFGTGVSRDRDRRAWMGKR